MYTVDMWRQKSDDDVDGDDDEKDVGVSVMVQCATANLAAQQGHSWKGRVLLLSPTMVRRKMNIVTDCRINVMIMLIKIFLLCKTNFT